MSEAVSFWMDNKNCTGKIVVISGDQTLVFYRDRYYVLKDGTAQTKGGKPLRYSLSSLPVPWKRALKGEAQLPVELPIERERVRLGGGDVGSNADRVLELRGSLRAVRA